MYEDFASRLAGTVWGDYDKIPERTTDYPTISELETIVIDGNFPWTIVKLTTEEGIVGLGEAYPSPGVHEVITDYLRPVLVGENPLDVERLYHLMRESLSGRGSQQGIGTIAISGVELALWDITGKWVDLPVYQLLGGKMRESIRIYADCHAGESMVDAALGGQTHEMYTPEAYAAEARTAVEEGYDIIKFDLDVPSGHEIQTKARHLTDPEVEHKRRLVEAVDAEVGDEAEVAYDLHWNFNAESAKRVADAIAPFNPLWLEDPLPPENTEAMARFRESVSIPILTGENRYGRHGFRDLLETDAVDFVAPDIPKTGGIAESKKIADLAEAYYVPLTPHNVGSPVATMAGVHLGASVSNFFAIEFHARDVPWWENLSTESTPLIQDGRISVPDRPGLGIELDWSVVDEHRKY